MVGTELGNVHNLQQGQGYATVVNQNALLEDALWQKKAGLLDKQQKKKEAIEDFGSYDPKSFYPHEKEIEAIRNGVLDDFIRLQEKGVDNPFKATDPESRALQQRAKRGLVVGEVAKKMEEKYFEFVNVLGDQEKAKKIKNADQIKTWFFETSPTKIVDEGIQFPEVEFYEPAFDSLGTTYKLGKTWVDTNNKTMSTDEAVAYADQVWTNPAYNEEGGYLAAMKQVYNSLDPEEKEKYKAKSAKFGNKTLADEQKFFIADQIRDASGFTEDLGAIMADDAKKANVSSRTDETGAFYTYKKGGEKEYAKRRVTSILNDRIGQIEREVEKGVYGDVNATPEKNFQAAFDHHYPMYVSDMERNSSAAKADSGAGAESEFDAAIEQWWYKLTQGTEFERQDAALYLFGSKDPTSEGFVASAKVMTPEEVSSAVYHHFPPEHAGSAKQDPMFKNPVLVVDVKDKGKLSLLQESKMSDAKRQKVAELAGKTDVAVYELTSENRQIYRKIYRESYKSQGSHYKPTPQSIESVLKLDE